MNIIDRVTKNQESLNDMFNELLNEKGLFKKYHIPQFDSIDLNLDKFSIINILEQEITDIKIRDILIEEKTITVFFILNNESFEYKTKRRSL